MLGSLRWSCMVGAALLMANAPAALAQECPLNSSFERIEIKGNVRTTHCRCNEGYEKAGGACVPRSNNGCPASSIKVRGICRALDLGTARARVLELKNKAHSHCDAMADIYDELSRAAGLNSERLRDHARQILSDEASAFYVRFNDSGFAQRYRDGGNQVRHFTAYFVLGTLGRVGRLGAEGSTLWQDWDEPADRALARVAADLGMKAHGSQQAMRGIGQAIRNHVCK